MTMPIRVEERVYEICLEQPIEDRAALLTELQQREPAHAKAIEDLVARLSRSEAALDHLPDVGDAVAPAWVADYRVVRELGRGGFGVVVLAEQSTPVHREVAIKLLLPGAVTERSLTRFEAERQALASMAHPGIAQVFDAGLTADGRPYFVMEFVPGLRLTRHCESHRLAIRERLSLFQQVCAAVQHAHHRGVIHRDLKPSNILVREVEGSAMPKIIDFGIAKASRRYGASRGLDTLQGQIVGSPIYMSPEQAAGDAASADTRSDVYSLGVVLYELLTGELPFDIDEDTATPRVLLALHDREPTRPSSRLVAERRRGLSRTMVADLDAIVLSAMAREREHRYQSPAALAEDLERFLAGEPVLAREPSLAYRVRKFVRRNRLQVTAAALVLVILLAATAISLVFAADASRQAVLARTNLDKFHQLSIGIKLDEAEAQLPELLPPWPHMLPRLVDWQARYAAPLRRELPLLRGAIERLRESALPYEDDDRERDRRDHPTTRQVARAETVVRYVDEVLRSAKSVPQWQVQKQMLEEQRERQLAKIGALGEQPIERLTYRFPSPQQQFLHDSLVSLARRAQAFVESRRGACAKVAGRIRRARELQARIDGPDAAAWRRVRQELREDERFVGLALQPQPGLVPIGRDPDSGLQEFYHWETSAAGEVPERRADGRLALLPTSGHVFVLLPGGRVVVGSQARDPLAANYDPDAAVPSMPANEVLLDPFFVSKFETTKAQWTWVGGRELGAHTVGKVLGSRVVTRRYPIENVSWHRCDEVYRAFGLALPTEAQWEYAARAGSTDRWPTGEHPESLAGFANLADRTVANSSATWDSDPVIDDEFLWMAPVGTFGANAFGLHDMVGNVGEWCADRFSSLAYAIPAHAGDGHRQLPDMGVRAARLSDYQTTPAQARVAARHGLAPETRRGMLGARPVRALHR